MVLSFSVVDGLDLSVCCRHAGTAHTVRGCISSAVGRVRRGEKGDWVMIQSFHNSANCFIGQTDKSLCRLSPQTNERACKKVCMSVKTVRRQIVNLSGVIADNADAISPRTATFNIAADKFLSMLRNVLGNRAFLRVLTGLYIQHADFIFTHRIHSISPGLVVSNL